MTDIPTILLNAGVSILISIRNYLTNAGVREWVIIGIWILAIFAFCVLLSVLADKWEGDLRHWMLIALVGFIIFVVFFLFFWWMELRQWEPLLSLF